MDEQAVREHAQAHIDALLAGDVGRATEHFSDELRRNLGQIMAQLPLPLAEGTVESVEMAGAGYVATLRLVGEDDTRFQTRWKDRHGTLTMVEMSRIAEPVTEIEATEPDMPA